MHTLSTAQAVTGGVDTHKDTHTAAALDAAGRHLGTETFPATAAGYTALTRWLQSFGQIARVGIEGTSSYGSGLTRQLREKGIEVVEVNRPNRQARRRSGNPIRPTPRPQRGPRLPTTPWACRSRRTGLSK